jgi:hypothetical protein
MGLAKSECMEAQECGWEVPGWLIKPTDTQDALLSLPFDCNDQLFEDISRAISDFNNAWVEAADGCWVGERGNARLIGGWNAFADHVKLLRQAKMPVVGLDDVGIGMPLSNKYFDQSFINRQNLGLTPSAKTSS